VGFYEPQAKCNISYNMMNKYFNKYWSFMVGIVAGAIAGFFYWQKIGCVSGTCMITSSPLNSTLYGAMLGGLFFSLFKKSNKAGASKG
jgi:hypothetical protein